MIKEFKEFSTGAILNVADESILQPFKTTQLIGLFTFIWTRNSKALIEVDGIPFTLETNKILALTPVQNFKFIEGEDLAVYQFNREFYCIKDHDQEVGCAGLIFFGHEQTVG